MVKKLLSNKMVVVSLILILAVVFVTVAAPALTSYSYAQNSLKERYAAPSAAHVMGTDEYGRDVFTRLIYSGRVSITVSFLSVLIALAIGSALGYAGGYFKGKADFAIGRVMDIMLSFPPILLSMIIAICLGSSQSLICIAIGVPCVPGFYRIARSETLFIANRSFVKASVMLGNRPLNIIVRHIVPNSIPQILITLSGMLGGCILAESSLGFLGLGVPPPTPSWGLLINDGKKVLFDAPWVSGFAGCMITLNILAFNMLADGLRDVLDPKRQER
ncbi:MAG: ABC transporter permease [Clostridiales bacterium]|jgi:ABC-type dipeptide/oligopeptide/nickel transport system permease subunit|nr:ABC transporter permease [Clostridiales bacterium]